MSGPAYPRERVEAALVEVALPPGYRIVPGRYLPSPLGTAPANSRFCTETAGFTILYTASDFASAFLETMVRDRFTRKRLRKISRKRVARRIWTRIESKPGASLRLLDLRRGGCIAIGAPTDAVRSRNQTAGQAFAKAIHADHADIDGFLYESRLSAADTYAVFDRAIFDRAIGKLRLMDSGRLTDHPELPQVLKQYGIDIAP